MGPCSMHAAPKVGYGTRVFELCIEDAGLTMVPSSSHLHMLAASYGADGTKAKQGKPSMSEERLTSALANIAALT